MNWTRAGDTETVKGTKLLEFVQSIYIQFSFEVQTRVRLELHVSGRNQQISESLVGVCECYLAELLALNGGFSSVPLQQPSETGEATATISAVATAVEIHAEEVEKTLSTVNFSIEAALSGGYPLGSSFFITISRSNYALSSRGVPEAMIVYRSSPTSASHSRLSFPDIELSSERLCRGDQWRPIEICLYKTESKGVTRLIGSSRCTYFDLDRAGKARESDANYIYLRLFSGETAVGYLSVITGAVFQNYSFLDYVTAGLEINVMVGIDFTRSNGDPICSKDSLHGFAVTGAPSLSNEYVDVINSVVSILQQYDSDRRFPLFGFGARLPPSQTIVSHCFALNGDFFHPEVEGIDGILEAYRSALGAVSLHGPTRFGDLLKEAKRWTDPMLGEAKYLVLLIITDGVIEDLRTSIDEIVELTERPISILIVGVGGENFDQMDILDGDDAPLVSSITGKEMERDIVQFVAFRDFRDKPKSELAIAALEEIPREVTKYFGLRNIFPLRSPMAGKRMGKQLLRGFSGTRSGTELFEVSQEEGSEDRLTPKHLEDRRTGLIITVQNQGYDEEIVERVVRETGVLCPDPMHVIDVMFHMHKNRDRISAIPRISASGQISIADRFCVADRIAEEARHASAEAKANKPRSKQRPSAIVDSKCKICFSNMIDIAIQKCGHRIICRPCFSKIDKLCPLCREVVVGYEPLANS